MIQLQTLNYILNSGDKNFINLLRPEYFSEYSNEFNYIKNHYDQYGNIPDINTFLNNFEDFDVIKVSEKPTYLISQLKRDKSKRDIIDNYNKMRSLINEDKVEEAIDYIKSSALTIDRASDIKYIDLLDATNRYDKYLDKCENKSKYFISTGFKELDRALGGWDALEELGVIVARPNVGKSQFAIKCATAALQQGLNVGIYSGEMSNEKVGYRVDTMIEHIPNYDLTRGDMKSQLQYKKYIDSLPYKFKGKFWCLTPLELGHIATVSDLKTFIEDLNLDILFIDQYSLLDDQHHAFKENEKFANISKDLKNLQVMLKIPIIAVSQQNRGDTENEDIIDVSHIAMSDRIGQDATTVLFLTCKNNILDVYISKSRDAEKDKKISYAIDWNIGTFQFIPEPDNNSSTEDSDDEDEINSYSSQNSTDDYEINAF